MVPLVGNGFFPGGIEKPPCAGSFFIQSIPRCVVAMYYFSDAAAGYSERQEEARTRFEISFPSSKLLPSRAQFFSGRFVSSLFGIHLGGRWWEKGSRIPRGALRHPPDTSLFVVL